MEPAEADTPDDCQLVGLYGGTSPLRATDRIRLLMLRLRSAVKRRIRRFLAILGQPDDDAVGTGAGPEAQAAGDPARTPVPSSAGPFSSGELVEVLSYREIKATLDENGTCDKLLFMEGMRKYCGTRRVVKKKLRAMFDECSRRMLSVRRARYILEGAECDGTDMFGHEGCDRCCYFFWTDRWLRKATP